MSKMLSAKTLRYFLYFSIEWSLIALCFYFIFVYSSALYIKILLWVVFGSRQHALELLFHEGIHRHISPDLRLNDILTNFLAGFWFLSTTKMFREYHFKHHELLGTDKDPELHFRKNKFIWQFPKKRWDLAISILLSPVIQVPIQFMRIRNSYRKLKQSKSDYRSFLLFLAVNLSLSFLFPMYGLFLIFWYFSTFTILIVFARLRLLGEHYRPYLSETDVISYDFDCPLVERLLFFPYSTHFHGTHHEHPNLPFWDLRKQKANRQPYHGLLFTSKRRVIDDHLIKQPQKI